MKWQKMLYMSPVFFISACGGPIAPVIPVTLPQREVVRPYTPTEVYSLRNELDTQKFEPIYLYIEDSRNGLNLMSNQSGSNEGLPRSFRVLAMSVATQFGDSVKVFSGRKAFWRLLNNPNKKDNAFEVEGAITSFDQNGHEISSGIDFGIEFGKGTNNDKYKNTNRISNLSIDLLFKQNGEIFVASSAEIEIHHISRGYSFGLRINNSGFGVNSYHTKAHGIGKSLRKILQVVYADLIKKTMEKKHPQFHAQTRTITLRSNTKQERENTTYNPPELKRSQKIRREEEEFLQRIRSY